MTQSSNQTAVNFAKWYAAMEASHQMLLAGLRDRVGPDGDIEEAYRRWQADRRKRKLRALEKAAEKYQQRMSAGKTWNQDAT